MYKPSFSSLTFFLSATISLFFSTPGESVIQEWTDRLDKSNFYALFTRATPDWMNQQIKEDFADFQNQGITQCALKATYELSIEKMFAPWKQMAFHRIHRYRCIDGRIYRLNDHLNSCDMTDAFLITLAMLGHLPNVDFIYCSADGTPEAYLPKDFWITSKQSHQAPLLARAKMDWAKYVVLIPDGQTLIDWYPLYTKGILPFVNQFSWEKKISKVAWRGTTSDIQINNFEEIPSEEGEKIYRSRPRWILCQLSLDHPDYVNAAFNGIIPYEAIGRATRGMLKDGMFFEEQMAYRYLPVLDGWCCTYPGYLWRLLSGCLTLKQENESIQWFYKALKPYVHYLPIKKHMEDLLEKIDWARSHDELCQQMTLNARDFVMNNLLSEHAYYYYSRVLEEYSKLQQFDCHDLEEEMADDPAWTRIY